MPFSVVVQASFATLCAGLVYGVFSAYNHRARLARWQKQGVRLVPQWSWFFGHLTLMGKATSRLPPDLNVLVLLSDLFEEKDDAKYYNHIIDLWPMSDSVVNLVTPEPTTQAFANHRFPKHSLVRKGMEVLTGGPNMLTMSADEWKPWRGVFNPGFSSASINAQIGAVVDRVEVFRSLLVENAGKSAFPLGYLTSRLTADVIVKLTLGLDLNHQREEHRLIHAYNTILKWHSFWDPRVLLNPARPFVQMYYGRVMDRIIQERLDDLFVEMRAKDTIELKDSNINRSIAGLALQQYMKDNPEQSYGSPNAVLDPVFRQYATYQVRLFLLAGNDTTSTTLMFIFHMLHKNPKCLQLMREEHHRVFGTVDDEDTAGQIRSDPALLNKLRYTDAVVKETMRIYPAGGASRDGIPGATVTDEEGEVIPLDHCLVSTNQVALHNNPRFWPRPNEFLPERWLVEPGHELYPGNTAAWRPFEHGPRNCIGQTLVWAELRTVLALTARTFTVTPAYEEWDAKREREEGMFTRLLKSMGFANPVRTYKGERAYMTDSAASRPSEGYPCRVELTSPH